MIQRIPLKDLCSIDITDGTHKTPTYADSGYIFLSSKNVTSGEIDWDNVMYIQEELHKELYQRLAPQKDDILLAKNGTTGVAALVDREEIFDIYVSLALIRPDKNKIIPKYLLYAINSESSKRYFDSHLKGVGVPNLHLTHIRETPISVPDFHTQEEIIKRLDKVSDLIAKRRQQMEKLDLLVKARFVEMFGDPIENNYGWSTHMLDSVCKTIVDCPHSTPRYTNVNTGYMCIRSSIVKKNRILWDEIEYISEQEYYQRIQRKQPKMGDVVYTREGAILGMAAMINCDCNVALGQRMMLLSPDTNICLPQFLSSVMNFESFLRKALKGLSGSASPHINVGDIKAFVIIIPPLALQQQYVSFFERTEETKRTISESLIKLETLKKALMQEYFG